MGIKEAAGSRIQMMEQESLRIKYQVNEDPSGILSRIRYFCLDMDGTVYLDSVWIDGAKDFLAALTASGRKFCFMTNNSSKSADIYIEKLHSMGLVIDPETQLVTSGHATIDYLLRNYPGRKVYIATMHAYDAERHDLFYLDDGTIDYPFFDSVKEMTARFFSSRMETSPVSLRQDPEDLQVFVINDTEVQTCLWKVEGGVILGKSSDTIRVLLFPDASEHSVSVSGVYSSGLTFFETVDL